VKETSAKSSKRRSSSTTQIVAPARGSNSSPSLELSGARTDDELVEAWLTGRTENTRMAYLRDLAWWRSLGLPPPRGWRWLRFRDYQEALAQIAEKGPSKATLARRIGTLRSLLAWAHRVGYCPLNVGAVIKPARAPNKLAERILEPEEVARLLFAAGQAPKTGARDHLFVRLAYVSGARVDELVGLDYDRVHASEKGGAVVTLHGKGSKTRHVWITQATFQELCEFDAAHQDFAPASAVAWSGPIFRAVSAYRPRLSVRDAERIVERAAKRAKLGKVSPHWLRHAHATHALQRGAPVHEVAADLGHSSVATTSRYLHARPGPGSARFLEF
jgi:integrase/recombinase XerD